MARGPGGRKLGRLGVRLESIHHRRVTMVRYQQQLAAKKEAARAAKAEVGKCKNLRHEEVR